MQKILMYTRFERFWHWSQASAIMILAYTGFEIRGYFSCFGFKDAVRIHEATAIFLMVLIVFTIFWHFTTGEWKQYLPTRKHLVEYIRYYIFGIFKGAPHPTHKTRRKKLNPLQRLTYLGLKLTLFPSQIIIGLMYLFYYDIRTALPTFITLKVIATAHVVFAFLFLQFLIVHIYLTTTGEKITTNIQAMITGYEEVPDDT